MTARASAERAVVLAPGLFAARHALGRALVESGEVERGIVELEVAARLAPESPEVFSALARAYGRAGRKEQAEGARARFTELDQKRRELRGESAPSPSLSRPMPREVADDERTACGPRRRVRSGDGVG